MSLSLIPDFKKEGNSDIINLIGSVARKHDVDCMNITGFCKATGETPVYVFVSGNEVVILMLDWRSVPEEELADEEEYFGNPPPILAVRTSVTVLYGGFLSSLGCISV